MLEVITLECPSCGGRTKFSNDAQVLVCDYCGNQHTFRLPNPTTGSTPAAFLGEKQEPAPDSSLASKEAGLLRPWPREVSIQKQGERLELSWRWFSWKYLPLAFFCVVWDGFLCFWYSIAFSTGAPLMMIVFPIVHLAVGVGLTYTTLAGFLNHSHVVVDRDYFSVSHGPLPWLGSLRVPVTEVEQLYCKQKAGRQNRGPEFQLSVILKDGRKKDLLSNLDSSEIGFYMEHQIETWLELPDRPVRGEIPD
jgi:hypothetical protein